jgi:acyl-coenzyme A thioesterase PaaI-like protein
MLALDLIERIRSVSPVAANAVLGLGIPQIIPLAAGLGMKVEEVSATRAVSSLPLKRRTRNHVGSIYFGAQMTQAEITMGLLLFHLYPPGPWGMLVKRVEADFHAKGKGTLRAVCEPPAEVLAALAEARTNESGKAEAWVPVRVSAADGQVVTEARFLAALKRF